MRDILSKKLLIIMDWICKTVDIKAFCRVTSALHCKCVK
jgi:hypothetical protein